MNAFFKLSLLASFVLLASCAAQEIKDYDGYAARAAVASVCEQRGLVSTADYAAYMDLQMGWGPRQFGTVNDERMQAIYRTKFNELSRIEIRSEADKQQFRVACANVTNAAANLRAGSARQIAPAYTPPITTNCVTTYGLTRCTSQ